MQSYTDNAAQRPTSWYRFLLLQCQLHVQHPSPEVGTPRCSANDRLVHFFLLLAARVRSSCEEGPGQSALQSAYHDPQLDVTELKQNRIT